jgi:hypothetical protein
MPVMLLPSHDTPPYGVLQEQGSSLLSLQCFHPLPPAPSKKVWYAAPWTTEMLALLPVHGCPGDVEFSVAIVQRWSRKMGIILLA